MNPNAANPPRPPRQSSPSRVRSVHYVHPRETVIEKLTRDLEAWPLTKGVIAKAQGRWGALGRMVERVLPEHAFPARLDRDEAHHLAVRGQRSQVRDAW